ncbi:MAG: SDR family oxidoreductase [Gammaproteobacteria bacterium]|jgi:3-oxoacyl-[acyl-carrier protein] reductase|nr:SDR family oxidoreductase [Gammaproteobacteria bacterium]
MKLKDSRIVITGAARGLGRAMARDLAEAGARLGLIDLDSGALTEALAELPGENHIFAVADVTDEAAITAAFDQFDAALGGIDAVINNAGITRDGLLIKARDGEIESRMSLEQWQQVISVNLTGVFLCGREAATRMTKAGNPGVIINIASISKAGNFGQTNYSAAKAGVAAMAVTWAGELARYGIRAVSVSPGFTRTELVAAMPEKAIDRITGRIPAGRLAEPEEIAATIRFVLENDYVNGRDIPVDGGLRL